MEKRKNFFRIDTGQTHGWQVRIVRNGERQTKLFSDKKYGGEEAACEKAFAHRNEKFAELPDLPEDGPLHADAVDRRHWESVTRTGVKGLGFTMTTYSRATDAKRPYVTAHWPGEERWRCTSFSIVKHGVRGALNEAALALAPHDDPDRTVEAMIDAAQPAVERLLEENDAAEMR